MRALPDAGLPAWVGFQLLRLAALGGSDPSFDPCPPLARISFLSGIPDFTSSGSSRIRWLVLSAVHFGSFFGKRVWGFFSVLNAICILPPELCKAHHVAEGYGAACGWWEI
eukprot:435866-Pleurochrysis_carterae.AAC.3